MSASKPLTRTLQEGKDWTENWQSKHKTLSKAFRIPVEDLVACFNEMSLDFTIDASTKKLQVVPGTYDFSLRGYLGIDYAGEEKLLIVGTETTDGKLYKDITTVDGGQSAIYDFTTPCPNDCDTGSLLYHKITSEAY
ncbi:hypothetical protein [uncultured Psychroserpens sp.]|uniref:hypothetical protein n=1 Tax=uncultured Psychroserpens sp. TaxID=255436 RepID=UPI00261DE890|nr:hypothetical protein [uncultured Psychroserpens sp.]